MARSLEKRLGLCTGNNEKFLRNWHEVNNYLIGRNFSCIENFLSSGMRYAPHNKGDESVRWYGNQDLVIKFDRPNFDELAVSCNKLASRSRYFQECVSWSEIGHHFAVRFFQSGFVFNIKGPSIFGSYSDLIVALSYLNSKVFRHLLAFVSQSMSFNGGDVEKVPFRKLDKEVLTECDRNTRALLAAATTFEQSREVSWDFSRLPLLTSKHRRETLDATYANLRTHWQSMTAEMQRLEEENNRIFIDAYGLQAELTAEVAIQEITLSCNPAYRYGVKGSTEDCEKQLVADTMEEFLSYAVGCMFGRYSLDAPGLILANQGDGVAEYLGTVPTPSFAPNEDNVIPMLDGDWFSDDISERFRQFLRVTFGEERFQENLAFIEDALGKDIRKYFTRDFFNDHVKRYKKRPIYWLFSSPKGTFNALIYMHRYRPDTVSIVLNDYLRELRNKLEAYRRGQEALSISGEASQGQRTKALKEVDAIGKQIAELDAYERDVLFPLASERIEIDLDDGVKANYPKFGNALKPIKGLSDADDD